ncbi:MAG: PTS system mannose/fructose/sorbose family transporter subunit IID [Erysipelotrichaceae bacterium]|nr:PTS system mannose/fructose/sorbose family transporter subunit IID [Erysipelotrichaceae bacterium]MDD3924571.1 PTS system mannose/fructose/sorbose family transporter subunit IID [Erysipelotrichaceae bacterium]
MSNQKLTKKELWKFSMRYALTAQACQNYETMQSCAVIYSMGPFLEKIYADDPELLKKKFKAHFQFFNCQTYFGAAINAAALAIEETKTDDATAVAQAIKTSLMGPFSGIGDALFNTMPKVILAALSAYAAVEGSFLTGAILLAVFSPLLIWARWQIIQLGYYQGAKIITEHHEQMNNIREAISVLGIIVIGALIATMVKVNTPLTITVGEAVQPIQELLDKIFPKLLPALATFLVYKGLDMKKMNTVKMVWLIIVVVMALSLLKVLG